MTLMGYWRSRLRWGEVPSTWQIQETSSDGSEYRARGIRLGGGAARSPYPDDTGSQVAGAFDRPPGDESKARWS